MRILVVGAEGTVGKAAIGGLRAGHEIIKAGRKSGDVTVDMMDEASVSAMYAKIGKVDAVVCAAGHSYFGPLDTMTPLQFLDGLKDKVMGMINLVLLGHPHVNDGGSFTLTSGILSRTILPKGPENPDRFATSLAEETTGKYPAVSCKRWPNSCKRRNRNAASGVFSMGVSVAALRV